MAMTRNHSVKVAILFCVAIALAGFVPRATADDDDPPSRVARLAYAQGSVSFQPAGTDDWVTAGLNRPLTTGDKLWSDQDGRVELQLDGSLIRLSNNTGFSLLNLGDNVTQIQLTAGTLLVRVRRLDDNETYEIDTPNLAFSVLRPGLYRISVNEAGDSTAIKIRSGQGEVTGEGAAYAVHANDSYTFSGTDQLYANSEDYGNREDQFDTWAATRDRHWENSNSARYVSPDVVGYEDLDDHGSWRHTPDNGDVWFPRTSVPGWAPYHNGHWDYIEPWGYTWVDDEPWGFAPFHYGRWVSYEGSWGWVPAPPQSEGVVYVRPVYAPALVAWVGGPHFAIGIVVGGGGYASGESVGWFPLGPREVYVPSYRVSRHYVENVNVSNTRVNTTVVNNYYNTTVANNNVNVTNVKYANQSVAGAVTATTPRAFTSAQPVAKNAVQVDQREVASAPVRAFTPAAVPAKQAVLGTGAAAAKPPAALETRAVVAKVAPPPPPPSFERRQEAIKSNGGKPLSVAQVRQIEPVAARPGPPVKIALAATPVVPQAAQTNRPGLPPNRQPAGQPAPAAPNAGNSAQPQNTPDGRSADRPMERPASPNNAPQAPQGNRPAEINNAPQATAPRSQQPSDRRADRPVSPDNANQPGNTPVTPNAVELPNRPANRPADRPMERLVNPNNAPQAPQGDRPAEINNAPQAVAPATQQSPGRRPDRPVPPNNANQRGNTPVTPNAVEPSNRPANRPADRPTERPVSPNNSSQPPQANRPAAPQSVNPNENPTASRPAVQPAANPELDRKQQQEQDQLRAKQGQDRQKVQQQQEQQNAKPTQQQAPPARKQQVEQQHQDQAQQLQQKQAEEQKALQEKQQQERKKQSKPPKDEPPSEAKP
jgi:hypothetical protein